MKKYYAVWIPMSVGTEFDVIKDSFGPICVKDIPNLGGVFFEGEIDAHTFDITLKYHEEGKSERLLMFHCETRSQHGFLGYSLELTENDFLQKDLQRHLPSCIYNFIKGFFHEHKWHDGCEDSVLPSYCSDESIDMSMATTRSLVVNNLLDAYEMKFSGHLESWSDSLIDLSQKILHGSKPYDDLFALLERVTDSYNVCGELEYCEYLLSHFKNDVSKAKRKDFRKLMANIQKTSNDMRVCYDRYISIVSLNDGRNSKYFGWIGFFFAILSILLTLLLEYLHSRN